MPCGRKGSGLGFAVAYNAGDDEIGIVEDGSEGMAKRIGLIRLLRGSIPDIRAMRDWGFRRGKRIA